MTNSVNGIQSGLTQAYEDVDGNTKYYVKGMLVAEGQVWGVSGTDYLIKKIDNKLVAEQLKNPLLRAPILLLHYFKGYHIPDDLQKVTVTPAPMHSMAELSVPKYIIGGTEVKVGQVYEDNHKAQIVIQDIDFEDSDGDEQAIYGSGFIYSGTGRCINRDSQLKKCIGVVTTPIKNETPTYDPGIKDNIFWHKWEDDGLEYPVHLNLAAFVEVKFENGETHTGYAKDINWMFNGYGDDVVAYRLIRSEEGKTKIVDNSSQNEVPTYDPGVLDRDGWKDHDGGKCPVGRDTYVKVKYYDGTFGNGGIAGIYSWCWHKAPDDIIAYKVIELPKVKKPKLSMKDMLELQHKVIVQHVGARKEIDYGAISKIMLTRIEAIEESKLSEYIDR